MVRPSHRTGPSFLKSALVRAGLAVAGVITVMARGISVGDGIEAVHRFCLMRMLQIAH
jgi:hypothetical protein